MRVLIADDEPGTRLLVTAAVQRLGHEAIGAADGTVARAGWGATLAQDRTDVDSYFNPPGRNLKDSGEPQP